MWKADFWYAVSTGNFLGVVKYTNHRGNLNIMNNHGDTPLGLAVKCGHLKIVQYLLSLNVNVNNYDEQNSHHPIFDAMLQCRKDILKELLEYNVNVNILDKDLDTPLLLAIRHEKYDEDIVDMLLKAGADVNYGNSALPAVMTAVEHRADVNKFGTQFCPPLSLAVFQGSLEITKYLLSQGANLNCKHKDGVSTCLSFISICPNPDIVELLVETIEQTGRLALCQAAAHGDLKALQFLLSKGHHPNATDSTGNTALTIGVKHRQENVAKFLIHVGVDCCKFVRNGQTPLSAAVETNNVGMVTYLLDHGAKPSLQTVLRKAVAVGNLEMVKRLKEKGAPLDATCRNGFSVLTTAVDMDQIRVVKYLLDEGVKIDSRDDNGQCALSIAASKSNFQLVNILLDRGADAKIARKELEKFRNRNEDVHFLLKKREG